MINQAFLDTLEPLQRVEFENRVVRGWRITWPDGSTEVVHGHYVQRMGEYGEVLAFHWSYLGAHRYVTLAHVRDLAEVSDPAASIPLG